MPKTRPWKASGIRHKREDFYENICNEKVQACRAINHLWHYLLNLVHLSGAESYERLLGHPCRLR